MAKRRRVFKAYAKGLMVIHGVYYDQWNVQVLYRKDIGWTGEQYNSIEYMFDMLGVNQIKIVPKLNRFDKFLINIYETKRELAKMMNTQEDGILIEQTLDLAELEPATDDHLVEEPKMAVSEKAVRDNVTNTYFPHEPFSGETPKRIPAHAPWMLTASRYIGEHISPSHSSPLGVMLQRQRNIDGGSNDVEYTDSSATFVCAVLREAGYPTPKVGRTHRLSNYGTKCDPVPGAIVIFEGFAGFIAEEQKVLGLKDGMVQLIPMSDLYSVRQVRGYRCPPGYY